MIDQHYVWLPSQHPLQKQVDYININTYILQKGQIFKYCWFPEILHQEYMYETL